MKQRYRIQFPKRSSKDLGQDETYFFLNGDGIEEPKKIRFHDYEAIYRVPGLYEQIFYDRLKCTSPQKVTSILASAVRQSADCFSEMRIFDLGAGNGMMGEELKKHGFSRLVGADIIPEAYDALVRDRPGTYDAYYVVDLTQLDDDTRDELASWNCDCMTTVAALGFGDIPTKAFIESFNIINAQGWVAFNIKETFFDVGDQTGFSRLIRELVYSEYLDIYHIERYRHRLSIDGEPLFYFAIAGRKNADVPMEFLQTKNLL